MTRDKNIEKSPPTPSSLSPAPSSCPQADPLPPHLVPVQIPASLDGSANSSSDSLASPSLSQIVRNQRIALSLSLSALSRSAGISKSYLSMIENDQLSNPPSADRLHKLEQALQLPHNLLNELADWERLPPTLQEKTLNFIASLARTQDPKSVIKNAAKTLGPAALDQLYKSGKLHFAAEITPTPNTQKQHNSNSPFHNSQPTNNLNTPPKTQTDFHTSNTSYVLPTTQVPLINKVPAGKPALFTDLDYPAMIADKQITVPQLRDQQTFAATITGQSMQPEYQPGDIVILSPAADITQNCDAFCRILPDHETTFKRIKLHDDQEHITLIPLNPKFESRTYHRTQIDTLIRAVGKYTPIH